MTKSYVLRFLIWRSNRLEMTKSYVLRPDLEEDWRRVRGGFEEGSRRVRGGLEEGCGRLGGGLQDAGHDEKLCFRFFAFLPPYLGVSGFHVHPKR